MPFSPPPPPPYLPLPLLTISPPTRPSPLAADGHPENTLLSSIYAQIATRNLYNAAVAGLGYDVGVGAR